MTLAQFLGETIMLKAFPIADMEGNSDDLGMDLRDYFAAKALNAFLFKLSENYVMSDATSDAYTVADEMMEARK
jgi:hypothetical protein